MSDSNEPTFHLEEEEEPHQEDGEGVWLVSYADLMTLLMGFFALLMSMGDFDEEKFTETAAKTAQYFGGVVEEPFEDLGKTIEKLIEEQGLGSQVKTKIFKSKIEMTFEGTLFFDSGSVNLREPATLLMNKIATILGKKAKGNKFLVEGHTDGVPISKGMLASNWELSALRAAAVARLLEVHGFAKKQIMTIGFAETRPLVNETGINAVKNRAKNRRIVLKVLKSLPL